MADSNGIVFSATLLYEVQNQALRQIMQPPIKKGKIGSKATEAESKPYYKKLVEDRACKGRFIGFLENRVVVFYKADLRSLSDLFGFMGSTLAMSQRALNRFLTKFNTETSTFDFGLPALGIVLSSQVASSISIACEFSKNSYTNVAEKIEEKQAQLLRFYSFSLKVFYRSDVENLINLFGFMGSTLGTSQRALNRFLSGFNTENAFFDIGLPVLGLRLSNQTAATLTIASIAVLALSAPAHALPQNAQVISGDVQINQSQDVMNITSQSNRSIVNYSQFNIAQQETVNFNLPSSQSSILNRVTGGDPSQIMGRINSNGNVFITNPSGIIFGKDSQINVSGLTATTLNIQNQNFLNNNLVFSQDGNTAGAIINHGSLNAEKNIVLMGGAIQNDGTIQAPNIQMAVGDQITMQVNDSVGVTLTVDQGLKNKVDGITSAINNTGIIQGGRISAQAKLAQSLYETTVNNEGVIEATGLSIGQDGKIVLISQSDAKDTLFKNTGTITASGDSTHPNGGDISIQADNIEQSGNILAEASSNGTGGHIDLIATGITNLNNGSLTSVQGNGQNSNAGSVYIWSDKDTYYNSGAMVSARGGNVSGDAGHVEISAHDTVYLKNVVDLRATQGKTGSLLIDPTNINIQTGDATYDPSIIGPQAGSLSYIATSALTVANNVDFTNATSVTLQGGTSVTLNADVTTHNAPLTLTGGSITLSSGKTIATNNGNVSITGNNTINISGTINAGTGTVSISNTGSAKTTTLASTASITGSALTVSHTVTGTGTIVYSGSTLNISGNTLFDLSGVTSTGTFTFNNGSSLNNITIKGNGSNTTATLSGALTGSSLTLQSLNLTLAADQDFSNTTFTSLNNLTINSGKTLTYNNASTLTLAGTLSNSGTLTNTTSALTVSAGTLTLASGSTVSTSNANISLTGANANTISGTINAGTGTIIINDTGSAKTTTLASTASLTGSALTVKHTVTGTGTIVYSGSTLNISGNTLFDLSGVTSTGTFTFNNGSSLNNITIKGNGSNTTATLSGALTGSSLTLQSLNLTLAADQDFSNTTFTSLNNLTINSGKTLTYNNASTLTLAGTLSNSGTLTNTTSALTVSAGLLTLNSGSTVSTSNANISLNSTGSNTISGTINAGTGTVAIADTGSGRTTTLASTASITGSALTVSHTTSGAGIITYSGATLNISGNTLFDLSGSGVSSTININNNMGTNNLTLKGTYGNTTTTLSAALSGSNVTLQNTNLTIAADNDLSNMTLSNIRNLLVNSGKTLTLSGSNATLSVYYLDNSGTITSAGSNMDLTATGGQIYGENGSSFTSVGGTIRLYAAAQSLALYSGSSVTSSNGNITLIGTGVNAVSGTIDAGTGSLTFHNNSFQGTTLSSTANITASSFTLDQTNTNAGIINYSGATLNISGNTIFDVSGSTSSSQININNTLSNNNVTLKGNGSSTTTTLAAGVTGSNLTIQNTTLTTTANNDLSNATLTSLQALNVNGNTLTLGASNLTLAGSMSIASGASLNLPANTTVNYGGSVSLSGAIAVASGDLTFNQTGASAGTNTYASTGSITANNFTIKGRHVLNYNGAALNLTGNFTVDNTGGNNTITLNSALPMQNPIFIASPNLTIAANQTFTTANLSLASLTINSGKTLTYNSPGSTLSVSSFTNSGTLTTGGNTLTLASTGAITLNSGSAINTSNGNVSLTGRSFAVSGDVNAGTGSITITGTGNALTNYLYSTSTLTGSALSVITSPSAASNNYAHISYNGSTLNITGNTLFQAGTGGGNIFINNNLSKDNLSLVADYWVQLNANLSGSNLSISSNRLTVASGKTLTFSGSSPVTLSASMMDISGTIDSSGNNLTINAGSGGIFTTGSGTTINTGGGDFTLNTQSYAIHGNINAGTGTVNLNGNYNTGTLTLANDLTITGSNLNAKFSTSSNSGTLTNAGATLNISGNTLFDVSGVYAGANATININSALTNNNVTFKGNGSKTTTNLSGAVTGSNLSIQNTKLTIAADNDLSNATLSGINNLTINSGKTLTYAGTQTITGTLTNNGTIDTAGSDLNLTAATMTLNSGSLISSSGGNIALTSASGYSNLAGSINAGSGALTLNATNSNAGLTLNGTLNAGTVNIQTPGNITLTSGSITSSDSGQSINIASTGGTFTNSIGNSALIASNGYWTVYTDTPTNTTEGFTSYNKHYGISYGDDISAYNNSNYFFYRTRPTLTFKASNQSKIFGNSNPVFTGSISGFIDGDNSSIITGQGELSTLATTGSRPGTYNINAALGTLANSLGYDMTTERGTLTVQASEISTHDNPYLLGTPILNALQTIPTDVVNSLDKSDSHNSSGSKSCQSNSSGGGSNDSNQFSFIQLNQGSQECVEGIMSLSYAETSKSKKATKKL